MFMGHVCVELASFRPLNGFLCSLIGPRPVKSVSVCFGHDCPRGCMVTTGPRVNLIQNQSTFYWRNTSLSYASNTLSVELPINHCESLGSADNLSYFNFILSCLSRYAMYVTVQSGMITKTSIIRSTTVGTSTLVGLVELIGCGGSYVKGYS